MIKKKYQQAFDVSATLHPGVSKAIRRLGAALSPLTAVRQSPHSLLGLYVQQNCSIPKGCPVCCVPRSHCLTANSIYDSASALLVPALSDVAVAAGEHVEHVVLGLYISLQFCLEPAAVDPKSEWIRFVLQHERPSSPSVEGPDQLWRRIWEELSRKFAIPPLSLFCLCMEYVENCALVLDGSERSQPLVGDASAEVHDPPHLCLCPLLDLTVCGKTLTTGTNCEMMFVEAKHMDEVVMSGPLYGVKRMMSRHPSTDMIVLVASVPLRSGSQIVVAVR